MDTNSKRMEFYFEAAALQRLIDKGSVHILVRADGDKDFGFTLVEAEGYDAAGLSKGKEPGCPWPCQTISQYSIAPCQQLEQALKNQPTSD